MKYILLQAKLHHHITWTKLSQFHGSPPLLFLFCIVNCEYGMKGIRNLNKKASQPIKKVLYDEMFSFSASCVL